MLRIRSLLCRCAACALFTCSGTAIADSEPASARRAATNLPMWMVNAQARLALEPAQQRELRALSAVNSERMREVGARAAGAQREQVAALQVEFRGALREILTPEQLVEWDALLEELLSRVHLRNAPQLSSSAH